MGKLNGLPQGREPGLNCIIKCDKKSCNSNNDEGNVEWHSNVFRIPVSSQTAIMKFTSPDLNIKIMNQKSSIWYRTLKSSPALQYLTESTIDERRRRKT